MKILNVITTALLASSFVMISSCQSNEEKRLKEIDDAERSLELLIEKEANKNESYKSMFAIPLNISKSEFNLMLDSLIESGEILTDGNNYHYFFDVKAPVKIDVKASYYPAFYNDTLYHIGISFEAISSTNDFSLHSLNKAVSREVVNLYYDKYGAYGSSNFISMPTISIDETNWTDNRWVKGNTEIQALKRLDDPLIVIYSHIPTKTKVDAEKEAEQNKNDENLKKAL